MSAPGTETLAPTYTGFVENRTDFLLLIEGCLVGQLHYLPRRPEKDERKQLIKSGNIFIYTESTSSIKRWSDGVAWSPSRILGDFVIHREVEERDRQGKRSRGLKRKRRSNSGEGYPHSQPDPLDQGETQNALSTLEPLCSTDAKPSRPALGQDKELERPFVGSLVDNYTFRPNGLVKKTMSIEVHGLLHHMVSYYTIEDAKRGCFTRPTQDSRLQIPVRFELYRNPKFSEHIVAKQMGSFWNGSGQPVGPGACVTFPEYLEPFIPAVIPTQNSSALHAIEYGPCQSARGCTSYGGWTLFSYHDHNTSGSQLSTGEAVASYCPPRTTTYTMPYIASSTDMQQSSSCEPSTRVLHPSCQTPGVPLPLTTSSTKSATESLVQCQSDLVSSSNGTRQRKTDAEGHESGHPLQSPSHRVFTPQACVV